MAMEAASILPDTDSATKTMQPLPGTSSTSASRTGAPTSPRHARRQLRHRQKSTSVQAFEDGQLRPLARVRRSGLRDPLRWRHPSAAARRERRRPRRQLHTCRFDHSCAKNLHEAWTRHRAPPRIQHRFGAPQRPLLTSWKKPTRPSKPLTMDARSTISRGVESSRATPTSTPPSTFPSNHASPPSMHASIRQTPVELDAAYLDQADAIAGHQLAKAGFSAGEPSANEVEPAHLSERYAACVRSRPGSNCGIERRYRRDRWQSAKQDLRMARMWHLRQDGPRQSRSLPNPRSRRAAGLSRRAKLSLIKIIARICSRCSDLSVPIVTIHVASVTSCANY